MTANEAGLRKGIRYQPDETPAGAACLWAWAATRGALRRRHRPDSGDRDPGGRRERGLPVMGRVCRDTGSAVQPR